MAASRKTSSCTTYHELQTNESRSLFSCLLCLQPSYSTRPQQLDCHHAFCERCLQAHHRLYSVNLGGTPHGNLVQCPICRQVTQVASNKTALPSAANQNNGTTATPNGNGSHGDVQSRKVSLATDAASQRCDACSTRRRVEVADFFCNKCSLNLCNSCKSAHDQQPLFTDHSIIHISNKDTVSLGCDIHGGRYVCTYYCYDCDIPACAVCLLHDHGPALQPGQPGRTSVIAVNRGSHRTTKLRDALAGRRDALKTLLNAFGPRLDRLEARMKRLGNCTSYSNPGSALIVSAGQRCHPYSLHGSSVGKQITTINLSGCSSPIIQRKHRQVIELKPNDDDDDDDDEDEDNAKDEHVVRFFIINNVSRSESRLSEDRNMNNNNDDDDDDQLEEEFDNVWNGHSTIELINDQLCHLRRLYETSTRLLELAQSRRLLAVHREVTSRLQTVLDVELPLLYATVNDILDAESTAASSRSFSPAAPGSNSSISSSTHLIRTRHSSGLSGTSCSGNSDPAVTVSSLEEGPGEFPLSLLIRPKLVWKFEKQRSSDFMGEMWNPCGVAFLQHDHRLVAAEYDMVTAKNNKIRIFDSSGKTLTTLMQGQIQPLGVAVTREGHVAVTDCIGKRVKILSAATGQLIADIGKGQFGWPYGIVVNSHGQLIVTDAFNDSVSIYNPSDGKRIRQFGSSGTRDANFRNPYHVTVDSNDNVLVSDSGNDCIKAFDPTGARFLFRCDVTKAGTPSLMSLISAEQKSRTRLHRHRAGGRLKGPRGVCVDLRGNILVADDCSRVCMFDSAGRYVRNLLTDEDQVKFPEAIHCSRSGSGLMALTEWNPNSMFAVKVFTLYE